MIDNLATKWTYATGNLRSRSAKIIVPKIDSVRKTLNIKPVFPYLEVHLVDHCNLNCKGCDHLSPIADKWFADLNTYERDLKQLQRLFSGIHTLCLLGGEPLLHPEVSRFLFITRSIFPKTNIQIMTNGLILDRMPDSFWNSCKETSTEIILDVYPPIIPKEESLVNLAKAKGVRMITRKVQSFQSFINLKGDSEPDSVFRKCPFRTTHHLKEGKLFTCVMPMVVQYFNKRFGTKLPSGGWVDIYAPNLTGWDVKKMLNQGSFSTCRYCSTKPEQLASASFQWTTSELKMSEWDVSTCR